MLDVSIDLHLHLDGSLSLSNVKQLAYIQSITLPKDSELIEMLSVDEECKDLGEYLEKFDFPLSLLQTEKAIESAVHTLCKELIAEGCIYAEIRFAPQLHTLQGLTQEQAVQSAINGFERSELCGGLILCCMRGNDNRTANLTTVREAERFLDRGVLALDLAGNEAGYPTENFEELFAVVRQKQIPFTIHAGEADGAQSVRSAVEMGAFRIGHGVRSLEDDSVISLLVDKKIPLELCPTSNINTGIFSSIEEYPIRELLRKGVIVTVNSDNRSVSATSAKNDIDLLKRVFDLTEDEEKQLLLNSIQAAFCNQETKKMLIKKVSH